MSEKNIFGCFVSNTADARWSESERNAAFEVGRNFRSYLWAPGGFVDTIKKLEHSNYGEDLVMVLFQFYIKPIPELQENLKAIEAYRKKEKAIGIPIILTDENFFTKSVDERNSFLKQAVLEKMDLLKEKVKNNNLDTKIDLLKADLEKILS